MEILLNNTPTPMLVLLAISELVSLICIVKIWRCHDNVVRKLRKLVWTFLVLIPLLGPVLYGGMYRVPSVQADHLRARPTRGAGGY